MSVLLLLVVGGTITFLGCGSEERSGPSESQFEEASKSVAPGLEEAVEEWASDVPEGAYILVPGYLPFDVEGYTNYLDSNPQYGMYDKEKRGLIIHVIDPNNLAFYERHGTIRIDGRSYYYNEHDMCSLMLWETSDAPQAFWLSFYGDFDCAIPSAELPRVLRSMIRVEGEEVGSGSEEPQEPTMPASAPPLEVTTEPSTSTPSPESTTSEVPVSGPEAVEQVRSAVEQYYYAVDREDWKYTYYNLDSQSKALFTEEEWSRKNQWYADNEGLQLDSIDVDVTMAPGGEEADVTVQRTFEDGSSITRDTRFVWEGIWWKHHLTEEEIEIFRPDLSYEEFVEVQQ